MTLKIKKLHTDAILPTKANPGDLGYDLYALVDTELTAERVTLVSTGIACNFPKGYGALLRDRSSVATKKEVFVVAGVIDEGYTGEVKVALYNPGRLVEVKRETTPYMHPLSTKITYSGNLMVKKGEKIAQMILVPVVDFPLEEVTELTNTQRGDKGFGSSGK